MQHLVTYLLGFALATTASVPGLGEDAATIPAARWDIGPVIRGRNWSVAMPAHPAPARVGWTFDFPVDSMRPGHVHYVTFASGSLAGARSVVVRYRVQAAPGTRFVPQEQPGNPGTVSLAFQREDDDWSGRGQRDYFRWYAPAQSVRELAPGEYAVTVNFADPGWVSVFGHPSGENREAFADAMAHAERIGLVFGSAGARGHGVYTTGPARFTLLSFEIR